MLTRKQIRTFSRTAPEGWKERSALERYDHEHGFRVKVAETACKRSGQPGDLHRMVTPIFVRECSCPWWEVCAPVMGTDDLSVQIDKSPLDVREISVLRSLGVRSVHDLVGADLGRAAAPLPARGATSRRRRAATAAGGPALPDDRQRHPAGTTTKPARSPCRKPRSRIDWDIENPAADRIYLWGFLVHDRSRPDDDGVYHTRSSPSPTRPRPTR